MKEIVMKKKIFLLVMVVVWCFLTPMALAEVPITRLNVAPWFGKIAKGEEIAIKMPVERDNMIAFLQHDLRQSAGLNISYIQAGKIVDALALAAKKSQKKIYPDGTAFKSMGWKSRKTGRIMRTANPVLKLGKPTKGFPVSVVIDDKEIIYVWIAECGNPCLESVKSIAPPKAEVIPPVMKPSKELAKAEIIPPAKPWMPEVVPPTKPLPMPPLVSKVETPPAPRVDTPRPAVVPVSVPDEGDIFIRIFFLALPPGGEAREILRKDPRAMEAATFRYLREATKKLSREGRFLLKLFPSQSGDSGFIAEVIVKEGVGMWSTSRNFLERYDRYEVWPDGRTMTNFFWPPSGWQKGSVNEFLRGRMNHRVFLSY